MTQKESQVNNGLEPSSQEASKELARSLLIEGASVEDVMGKTTLSKPAILGLKGAIAKAKKRLVQHASPTEAISKPQFSIQAENIDINGEDDIEEREERQDASQHSSLPSGTLLFEQGDLEAIRNLIPKPHQATYIAHLDVVAKRQRLGHGNNGHNNNGYGMASSADEELKRAEAEVEREYAKSLRDERMRERTGHGQKDDSELSRRLDRIENKLDNNKQGSELLQFAKAVNEFAQPKGHGVDPGAYIQQGIALVKDVEKNVNSPSPKNQYDLEVEKLRSERDIDNRKIDFEEKKWEHQKDSEGKTIEKVTELAKTVLESPIGKLISGAGEGVKNRIEGGQGGRMPMADVLCPNCGNKFKANPNLDLVTCNVCGRTLQKQPTPQPQPTEPQPEATQQPSTEEPKPEQPEPSQEPQVAEPAKLEEPSERWSRDERREWRKTDKREVI